MTENLTAGSRAGRNIVLTAKNVRKIQFFAGDSFAFLSELEMPAPVHELALSPDGRKVVGSVYGGGVFGRNRDPDHRLVVVDLQTRSIDGFIPTEEVMAPHGLMFDPDGLLWVTGELNRLLMAVDFGARRIVRRLDIGGAAHWLTIDPKGRRLYASNKTTDCLAVIPLDGSRPVDGIHIANLCEGLAIAPDAERIYVAAHAEPAVNVIDTRTSQLIGVLRIEGSEDRGRQLRRVAVSPDGRFVLVSSQLDANVAVFRLPELRQTGLIAVGKSPMGFGFPEEAGRALICNHDDGTVYLLDLEAGAISGRFTTGLGCEFVTYYG